MNISKAVAEFINIAYSKDLDSITIKKTNNNDTSCEYSLEIECRGSKKEIVLGLQQAGKYYLDDVIFDLIQSFNHKSRVEFNKRSKALLPEIEYPYWMQK
jgi:hypothetical protein